MKNILLASFVEKDQLDIAIAKISSTLNLSVFDIFIFKTDIQNLFILTYNISPEFANIKFNSVWSDTISIHRKKETNTLFSINAMNEIIKLHNNGQLNNKYKINWNLYKNSIILIRNGKLSVISITLIKLNR